MYINKKILFAILLFFSLSVISQHVYSQNINDNIQVANKYYYEKNYEKAAILYKGIFESTKYKAYRDLYVRCLFQTEEYKKAEDFLKYEIRRNPSDFFLKIDMGMVYFHQNLINKADKLFLEVIDIAKNERNNVNSVANSFMSYQQYDYAKKMYEVGGKTLSINFDYELGTLFYIQRDYKSMMEKYCSVLVDGNESMVNKIQYQLQYILATDINNNISEVIETTILKELQRHPSNTNLIQLLYWQYSQTGQNQLALNQLIALDKRTNNSEREILDFAITLKNNKEYDIAITATNYLTNKGESNDYYVPAFIEASDIKFKRIVNNKDASINNYEELEADLTKIVTEYPNQKTYYPSYNLIVLKAYYLQKYSEAIELADKLLKANYFSKSENEKLKLLLGDIYFISGNQWDAILYYAEVENSSKESTIGHEARLKKAKLAYYIGQFKWAQAQLNVLKASTSKLISNNALELSIFISENYDIDTTETTMRMFSSADFLLFSKDYKNAILILDSISTQFSTSSLIDDALYRKAFIFEEQGMHAEALNLYKKIFTDYYYDILADNALFRYAIIQNNLKNFTEADDALFKLISDYPSSIFANEARNIIRTKAEERKTIKREIDFWNFGISSEE